jgi:hypothetical protein
MDAGEMDDDEGVGEGEGEGEQSMALAPPLPLPLLPRARALARADAAEMERPSPPRARLRLVVTTTRVIMRRSLLMLPCSYVVWNSSGYCLAVIGQTRLSSIVTANSHDISVQLWLRPDQQQM